MTPWPCTILAIDPGRVSGWAVLVEGSLSAHGAAQTSIQRSDAAGIAESTAWANGHKLVVVAEKWQGGWRGDRKSARTVAGLGASWGKWEAVLEGVVPKRRIVRVGQSTWRARVLGGKAARKTEAWKADAIVAVKYRYGVQVSGDEAEAILIGTWGAHAREVGRVLPKRLVGEVA